MGKTEDIEKDLELCERMEAMVVAGARDGNVDKAWNALIGSPTLREYAAMATRQYPALLRRFKAIRELPWDYQRDWTADDYQKLRQLLDLPAREG